MEGLPPRHALHAVYDSFLDSTSDEEIRQLEREAFPCTLQREACYQDAVEKKLQYVVKMHLEQTPQIVNMATDTGVTALMQFGHVPQFVRYLLSLGADVNTQDLQGDSVLMHFVKRVVDPEAVKILLEAGANVNVRDRDNKHVIMHAANLYKFDVSVVKLLLAVGASVQDLGTEATVALISAVQNPDENVELVKTLIDAGTDVNSVNYDTSESILMQAVSNSISSTHVVRMLIDAGADVNAKDESWSTFSVLVNAAVVVQHEVTLELVKLLIDAGANVNVLDSLKQSVLMLAALMRRTNVVALLIEGGADVNHHDDIGRTALMMSQDLTVIKRLVEAGANVNAKDNDGNSVLMCIVCNVDLEIVKYLTKLGADVLAENETKETVLTKAIQSFLSYPGDTIPIIQHLLQHPALNDNVEVLFSGANHPQKVLLLFDVPKYEICLNQFNKPAETLLSEEILQLLKLILHSQFKDTRMLETVNLEGHFIDMSRTVDMCSIALFMCKRSMQIADLCVLQSCVQVFLDAGFDMKDGISPLTIFIWFWQPRNCQDDSQPIEIDVQQPTSITKFINFLISHGAHVAQQKLPLRDKIGGDLLALRAQLYLPDALFAALIKGNGQAVRSLLPFWGFPALYVLLFTRLNDTDIFNSHLLAVLTEHGGVPHGTKMFRKLTQRLQHPNPLCGLFHNMQSSPLLLRELCRYQVRASLAPRASHADHSLPSMILELSPPGLKDFLLMQPSSHLELLKCHDERRVP